MLRHCDRAQPQRHVVLVGARDLNPPEVTYLARAQIRRSEAAVLSASDLPDGPLYAHLDLDVVDSAEAPGLHIPRRAAQARHRSPTRCTCCSARAGSPP